MSNIKIVKVGSSDGYLGDLSYDNDYRTWITVGNDQNGKAWIEYGIDYKQYVHQVIYHHLFYTNWASPFDSPCTRGDAAFVDCARVSDAINVEVLLDGVQEKKCGEIRLSSGLTQQEQQYTMACNAYGDTIKISSSKEFHIADIIVIGNGKHNEFPLHYLYPGKPNSCLQRCML